MSIVELETVAKELNIIPKPNGAYQKKEGLLKIKNALGVELGGFHESCLAAFEQRSGCRCNPGADKKNLVLEKDKALAPEGYVLNVTPDRVTIKAATETGVIWALTTLAQCMGTDGSVPCFSLSDEPRYGHRGLLLDCCRHYFDAEQVQSVIEQMSLAKMNVLHWHLTEDQGWRIESKVFPQLHEYEGQPYFTQDEIRDVVAFATQRGVDVIPEIDMPGHTLAALAAMPELGCTGKQVRMATTGGVFDDIMCAGKDSTFDIVFKILDEVCELFPSPYFHIGGDEAPKTRWKQCPDCNARLKELGLSDYDQLQSWFTGRLIDYLKTKGKTAMCWNDILRGGNTEQDCIIQYWLEIQKGDSMRDFFDTGGQVIFSDMFHVYLDYPHGMTPMKRVYHYTPYIQKQDCSAAPNTMGIQCCLWTERIETVERLQEQLYPRLFAVAEAGWTQRRDYESFKARLNKKAGELDSAGIHYMPIVLCDPKGKARREQTLDYARRLLATSPPKEQESEDNPVKADFASVRPWIKYFVKLSDVPGLLKILRQKKP